jgi:hypothetical protein
MRGVGLLGVREKLVMLWVKNVDKKYMDIALTLAKAVLPVRGAPTV